MIIIYFFHFDLSCISLQSLEQGHWGWILGHFMCWFCLSLILAWPHLWSYISRVLASSHCSFHFPKLHELFHWSGPSLLGNTMATVLARADLSLLKQTHMCNAHTHTHALLLLLEFPHQNWAIDILYPPWPLGLTSQNWAVIKADKQVELYYQPLDTSYRNSHRSSKIQCTGKSCKIKKSFWGSRNTVASSGARRVGFKLFTADARRYFFPPWMLNWNFRTLVMLVWWTEADDLKRDWEICQVRMHLVHPPPSFALNCLSFIQALSWILSECVHKLRALVDEDWPKTIKIQTTQSEFITRLKSLLIVSIATVEWDKTFPKSLDCQNSMSHFESKDGILKGNLWYISYYWFSF